MQGKFASTRLLIFLLLPAVLGCQLKSKGFDSGAHQAEPMTLSAQGNGLKLTNQEEKGALQDQRDKAAYGMGLDVAKSLLKQEPRLNPEPLLLGLRDGLQKNPPLVPDEELGGARRAFFTERMLSDAKLMGGHAEKNLLEGEAFLKENENKEGVKTLASGLQYRIVKEGTGKSPTLDKDIEAHYIVRSIDGTELENTYKGMPAVLPLRGIIQAWVEALQLMKEGGKWVLYAPSYLAYGDMGSDSGVGPYQTLIFEIEFLKIK